MLSPLAATRTLSPLGMGLKFKSLIPDDSLQLWVEADFISGLTSSDPITSFTEASPNARTVEQGSASRRPLYITGVLNGFPVMRFDGTDDQLLTTNTVSGTSGITVVAVAKADVIGFRGICNPNGQNNAGTGTNFALTPEVGVRTAGSFKLFNQDMGTSVFRVVAARVAPSKASGDIEAWLDGTALSMSSQNSQTLNIGNFNTSIGQDALTSAFDGDIAAVIIYSTNLSNANLNTVCQYLGSKYNISVSEII
jgi:hypothetical protein